MKRSLMIGAIAFGSGFSIRLRSIVEVVVYSSPSTTRFLTSETSPVSSTSTSPVAEE